MKRKVLTVDSTEQNQWYGIILSTSITELLTQGAMLPLHQLTDASTDASKDALMVHYKHNAICSK